MKESSKNEELISFMKNAFEEASKTKKKKKQKERKNGSKERKRRENTKDKKSVEIGNNALERDSLCKTDEQQTSAETSSSETNS